MLDGDEAGRLGTAAITGVLAARMPVTPVALQDGTQPDQLTSAGIQHLMQRHATATETMEAR